MKRVLSLLLIAALSLPTVAYAGTIPGALGSSSETVSESTSHSSSTTHSSSSSSGSTSSSSTSGSKTSGGKKSGESKTSGGKKSGESKTSGGSSSTGSNTSSGSTSHSSTSSSSESTTSGIGKMRTDGTSKGPIKGWIYDPVCGPCEVDLNADFAVNLLTDTTVYTPKITMIHNMNAMCAQSNASGKAKDVAENDPVYYIPTTEDLPFDIKQYVQSNTGKKNRHSFSYVYDGFFDAEANLDNGGMQKVNAKSGAKDKDGTGQKYTAKVSKSIDTKRVSNPALKTIGYDLLLSSETYNVWKDSKGNIRFTNTSTPVIAEQTGTSSADKDAPNGQAKKINYQTAVMDIYKALGQYEYYITMAFTQDQMWKTNESPILSELSVATSAQKTDGMDITESYCGMAVTRTKPSLYMDKLYKDGITTRGMEDTGNPSEILHSGSDLSKKQAITFGEFCHLLVPLMNLYGEETVSKETLSHAAQCYSQEMACIDNMSTQDKQIIVWMLAKGLIDGEQLSKVRWDSPVVLLDSDVVSGEEGNYIIDILGRIADPDRRVKYSLPASMDSKLAAQGFGEVNVSVADETYNVSERPNTTFDVYDYFIEFNLSTCYRLLEKTTHTDPDIKRVDAEYEQALKKALSSKNDNADDNDDTEEADDEYAYREAFADIDAVKSISTSYMRLYENDGKLINMSEYDFYDNVSAKANQYHYYGIEQIGDKRYYHFKVNKRLAAAGFKVGFEVPKEVLKKTNVAYSKSIDTNGKFITLSSDNVHSGGVFDYNTDELPKEQQKELAPVNKESKHQTISDLELGDLYTDATSKTTFARHVADSFTSIIFYKKLKKFDTLENDETFLWKSLIDADGTLKIGKSVPVAGRPNDTYVYIQPFHGKHKKGEDLKEKYYRVEVQTKVPDLVKACEFFKGVKTSHESLGYYRYSDKDGTSDLLISFSYLKDNKIVTAITNSDDKKTWIISAGEFQNNIIMHEDDEKPYIIVGETLITLPAKTVLVHTVNGEYYINYRACLGWAKEFALVDTSDIRNNKGDPLSVMAVPFTEAAIGTNDWKQEIATVQLPYSGGHPLNVTTNYIKFNKKKAEFSGIPLTASYALAPYMLVMDMSQPTGGADYLFVWHSTHVVTTDGNKPIKDAKKIKYKHNKAIETLNDVLPIKKAFKKNECKDYYLTSYRLSRADKSQNPVGLNYVSSKVGTKAGPRTVTMGYWWTPPVCDRSQGKKVQDYLDAYAKSIKRLDKNKKPIIPECILPIIEVRTGSNTSRLMDVNVNTSAKTDSSKPNKLGTLPCYYMDHSPSEVKKWAKLDADGYPNLVDSSKDTSSYVTFTAPVSLFAQLKGLGTLNLSQTSATTVYFGTVPCEYDGSKVTINGHESSLKKDDKAICTYLGSGASTVYAITVGGTAIGRLLDALNEEIGYILNDPSSLVDWGQFKFHRLVQNMDAWSTIVLIFVLNILPRVCLLLFFALMLLSLIKDVKPWQLFCNRVFDIYSFLSFGRYTVQTIDTRQTVITSLICFSIFLVIMDGQLFNFIIWVCKFFIALYQR